MIRPLSGYTFYFFSVMRSYIAFRYPIIVRTNLMPRSEFHESLNEVLGSYLEFEFLARDFAVTKFKDYLLNKA